MDRLTVAVLQGDGVGGKEFGLEDVLRLVESKKQLSTADSDDTDTVEAFVALGGKVSTMLTANTAVRHSGHVHKVSCKWLAG